MLRIVAVVVLVALCLVVFQARRGPRMELLEAGEGDIGSLEGDQRVLAQLREAGADLSKPTEINYYLYFPDRQSADSTAAHVGPGPLKATVRRAADDSAWLCLVTGTMVPTEGAIRAYTTRLVDLARTYHGVYDGWEAALTK